MTALSRKQNNSKDSLLQKSLARRQVELVAGGSITARTVFWEKFSEKS